MKDKGANSLSSPPRYFSPHVIGETKTGQVVRLPTVEVKTGVKGWTSSQYQSSNRSHDSYGLDVNDQNVKFQTDLKPQIVVAELTGSSNATPDVLEPLQNSSKKVLNYSMGSPAQMKVLQSLSPPRPYIKKSISVQMSPMGLEKVDEEK